MKHIRRLSTLLTVSLVLSIVGCDDANELLNQHIKDGPIIYAAKIDSLSTQSGYYRFQVNITPADDINKSHCILSWNISGTERDSVKIDYVESNFNPDSLWYSYIINIPEESGIQGNLALYAQNIDIYGNRSLTETSSVYIYGTDYAASLMNAPVSFSIALDQIIFESRVGAVGNLISYERQDGSFTEEVFVTDDTYPLVNAKNGGVVRTKTRFLIRETDIDTIESPDYLETIIE